MIHILLSYTIRRMHFGLAEEEEDGKSVCDYASYGVTHKLGCPFWPF